jgi:hypothetical protein
LLSSGQPGFFYSHRLFLIFDRDTEEDFFFLPFGRDTKLKFSFLFFSHFGLTPFANPNNIRAVQYGRSAFDGRREQQHQKFAITIFR